MSKKTVNIKNFIGIYDGYILKSECDKAIKMFEEQDKLKKSLTRLQFENASSLIKKDKQLFLQANNIDIWWSELESMMVNFDIAWKHYLTNTGADKAYSDLPFYYSTLKLQKTLPTEGYHIWHIEHGVGYDNEPRAFVFSIYLNDVKEGGETEFLHQSIRVKPKTGRIVIWPAGFPYLHRGNPPLKGEKYILTSWMKVR